MEPILLALREQDRMTLLKYGLDLNEFLEKEMYLVMSIIETVFDEVITEQYGYFYNLDEILQIAWVKKLHDTFETIKNHLSIDNGVTEDYDYLWTFGQSEVKITLTDDSEWIGHMTSFDDDDPHFAWLTFRLADNNEEKNILYNDVKKVVLHQRTR